MSKAVLTSTTSSNQNPYADVFHAIGHCAALWRECQCLDERPGSPTYEASVARATELLHEACDLERKIAMAEVSTPQALAAKIRTIRDAEFDEEDMPAILERLALDAERIAAAR
jgi:hypothetical protein